MGHKFIPQSERDKQDYLGGKESFEHGMSAGLCPFAYKAVGYPPQDEFETKYRDRLNMWMQGWLDAQEASR